MSRILAAWLGAPLLLGCGVGELASIAEVARVDEVLAPMGLSVVAADTSIAPLAWAAPSAECPHALRIAVAYEPDLKFEQDNVAGLAIGRDDRQGPWRRGATARERKQQVIELPDGPIPADVIVPADLFYRGFRAERVGATRDLYLSRELWGPASPMAACFWRTWDPMDDALALGWPVLPGRMTAIGETWNGINVEAKCSRAACVDPQTGGAGPTDHHRACVTAPWRESLAGVFDLAGERWALVRSQWDDGHDGAGISSERMTLVSVDHGRPVWSRTVVDHKFLQPTARDTWEPIVRTWELTAVDACPGSLASAGWSRPDEVAALADDLVRALADAERLRRRDRDQEPEE